MALTCLHGLYRFARESLRWKNASETFQHAIDVMLSPRECQFVLIYPDGTLVFSHLPRDQIEHVRSVLILFQEAWVPLKLKKCSFATNIIDYLDHAIWSRPLVIAIHTADTIIKLKPPTNTTKPCSFLELWSVLLRFVPNFAHRAVPPKKKFKKDQLTQSDVL